MTRPDRPVSSQPAEGASVVPGKGTRRRHCTGCDVLVLVDALDASDRCESCASQRTLFPVKAFRRRLGTGTWSR